MAETSGPKQRVGGRCFYKSYEGTATILSVRKMDEQGTTGGTSCERFEVKFRFQASERIEKEWLRTGSREGVLLLKNFANPGPNFIEKFAIEPGKVLDCNIKVIEKGTCTPVLFDFPGLDLTDIC
ncbi:MAG: hypothetical protein AAGU11_05105 [Syntrophobacteraceae bacterium]